jgi:hypothetical protein
MSLVTPGAILEDPHEMEVRQAFRKGTFERLFERAILTSEASVQVVEVRQDPRRVSKRHVYEAVPRLHVLRTGDCAPIFLSI